MKVYSKRKQYRKRNVLKFMVWYGVFAFLRFGTLSWIGWIYEADSRYDFFYQSSLQKNGIIFKNSKPSNQKILVASSMLMHRIANNSISIKKQPFQVGEILLVKSNYPSKHSITLKKILLSTLNFFTFGIVKSSKNYVFRKVVAVPGDHVVYNAAQVISINENNVVYVNDEAIPFMDEIKSITLLPDEYLLVSSEKYAIDDKITGPSNIRTIKGKAVYMMGPHWGSIDYTNIR